MSLLIYSLSQKSLGFLLLASICAGHQIKAQEGLKIVDGTISVGANHALVVGGKIINNKAASNFIVESDANLVQIDNTINEGNITVYRDSPMKKNNYTYWSSPVTGQQLGAFSPNTSTSRFYQYIENTNQFGSVSTADPFILGKGYAIMAPKTYSPETITTFKGTFVGIPNNGNGIKIQLEKGTGEFSKGFNMTGNPYPSDIDFEKLFSLSTNSDKIYQMAYFWTNVDPNRPGSVAGNRNYSGNAYAIYNGTGGSPSGGPAAAPGGGEIPTGIIKVGQGFIVKAKPASNGGEILFDNSIRLTSGNSHFFSKPGKVKDRFWLKLTTPADNVNTILIGYIQNATNGFEYDYDSPLMVVGSDSFYSILGDMKLAIQGRAHPHLKTDFVTLGTKHFERGNYKISLGDHEGLFSEEQDVFLLDNYEKILTNLSERDYVFNSDEGEYKNRFEIVYIPQTVLGIGSPTKSGIQIFRDALDFVVKSPEKKIVAYEVFDMSGRMIYTNKSNAKEIRFSAEGWVAGLYIIKAELEDGNRVTVKVRK